MRWEREKDYIEIECGCSVDHRGAPVAFATSSIDLKALPMAFQAQVRKDDHAGVATFTNKIAVWAEAHEFRRTTIGGS